MKQSRQSAPTTETHGVRIASCELQLTAMSWRYAEEKQEPIDRHWQAAVANNPQYFNGTVLLFADWTMAEDETFRATLLPVEFKAYLYWRLQIFEAAGVWDGFGSTVVRAKGGGGDSARPAKGRSCQCRLVLSAERVFRS